MSDTSGSDPVGRAPYREASPPSERGCPRCEGHAFLRRTKIGATTVHRCEQCAGAWLSRGSFRLVREDEGRQTELVNLLGVPRHTADDGAMDRPCPECGEAMRRLRFPRDSRVIVDECEAHGVWFDPGELAATAGALTEARRGFVDRLIWLVEHWP